MINYKLGKLVDRSIFVNENGTVRALMTIEEFKTKQGEQFLGETFEGSLPKFIATFSKNRKLSDKEVEELRKLIEEH